MTRIIDRQDKGAEVFGIRECQICPGYVNLDSPYVRGIQTFIFLMAPLFCISCHTYLHPNPMLAETHTLFKQKALVEVGLLKLKWPSS